MGTTMHVNQSAVANRNSNQTFYSIQPVRHDHAIWSHGL